MYAAAAAELDPREEIQERARSSEEELEKKRAGED